ncbi:hypothetical protein NKR23_g12006 [Pleurostoma richardsiae]|uniref:SCP domain-containing protein n=1 Tax=Pleurostoma richardsiae TaxID=41990 RepID=A0AA38RAH2_9PEZI|nr:hypothetical protein NKR23_g12006 [Pleurostoma richardsiae]
MQIPFASILITFFLLLGEFKGTFAAPALTADQTAALAAHNSARAAKKVPALAWDATLASAAQTYAEKLAKTGTFAHSGVAGENLFWESPAGKTPLTDATKAWLAEAPNYHNEVIPQGSFAQYGHYTQCMWKSTTKVGLGSAKDSKGAAYVVGRYSPPGNYVGQRPY